MHEEMLFFLNCRVLEWKNVEVNMNENKFNHLRHADDLVIIATNFEEIQTILIELTQIWKKRCENEQHID